MGVATTAKAIELIFDSSRATRDRMIVCSALGLLGDRTALRPLLNLAQQGSNGDLESEALTAVGLIGSKQATRPLLSFIKYGAPAKKKQAAIFALGLLADTRARYVLIWRLSDRSEIPSTRVYAAEALGMMKVNRPTMQALKAALMDPEPDVRYAALCGLGATRARGAIPEIALLLMDHSTTSDHFKVSERARDVLITIESGHRGFG